MGKRDFPWVSRQLVWLVCRFVFILGRSSRFSFLFRMFTRRVMRCYDNSLSGLFPVEVKKGVVFVSCDEKYFKNFAVHLVRSTLRNSQGFNIHLHLNNPSDQSRLELRKLAETEGQGLFTFTWDDLDFASLSGPRRWYYLASVRFVRLYQLARSCKSPILSLDADSLVVRSLEAKFAQVADHDTGIYLRLSNTLDWRKVLASALFIMPTKLGDRYTRDVAVAIAWLLHGKLHYHIDQLVIYYMWALYKAKEKGFRVTRLTQELADWECTEGSYVWSPKGDRKYFNRKFLRVQGN